MMGWATDLELGIMQFEAREDKRPTLRELAKLHKKIAAVDKKGSLEKQIQRAKSIIKEIEGLWKTQIPEFNAVLDATEAAHSEIQILDAALKNKSFQWERIGPSGLSPCRYFARSIDDLCEAIARYRAKHDADR